MLTCTKQEGRFCRISLRLLVEGGYFLAGALLITTLFFLPVFPSFMLIDWIDDAVRFPALRSSDLSFQLVKYFKRVYMGPRSAVLCSDVVADNAKLSALTLVMKAEFIPAASS